MASAASLPCSSAPTHSPSTAAPQSTPLANSASSNDLASPQPTLHSLCPSTSSPTAWDHYFGRPWAKSPSSVEAQSTLSPCSSSSSSPSQLLWSTTSQASSCSVSFKVSSAALASPPAVPQCKTCIPSSSSLTPSPSGSPPLTVVPLSGLSCLASQSWRKAGVGRFGKSSGSQAPSWSSCYFSFPRPPPPTYSYAAPNVYAPLPATAVYARNRRSTRRTSSPRKRSYPPSSNLWR